jgi:hypothetical protein
VRFPNFPDTEVRPATTLEGRRLDHPLELGIESPTDLCDVLGAELPEWYSSTRMSGGASCAQACSSPMFQECALVAGDREYVSRHACK